MKFAFCLLLLASVHANPVAKPSAPSVEEPALIVGSTQVDAKAQQTIHLDQRSRDDVPSAPQVQPVAVPVPEVPRIVEELKQQQPASAVVAPVIAAPAEPSIVVVSEPVVAPLAPRNSIQPAAASEPVIIPETPVVVVAAPAMSIPASAEPAVVVIPDVPVAVENNVPVMPKEPMPAMIIPSVPEVPSVIAVPAPAQVPSLEERSVVVVPPEVPSSAPAVAPAIVPPAATPVLAPVQPVEQKIAPVAPAAEPMMKPVATGPVEPISARAIPVETPVSKSSEIPKPVVIAEPKLDAKNAVPIPVVPVDPVIIIPAPKPADKPAAPVKVAEVPLEGRRSPTIIADKDTPVVVVQQTVPEAPVIPTARDRVQSVASEPAAVPIPVVIAPVETIPAVVPAAPAPAQPEPAVVPAAAAVAPAIKPKIAAPVEQPAAVPAVAA